MTLSATPSFPSPAQRRLPVPAWPRYALAAAVALALALAAWTVLRHEHTLRHGQPILLELAPVDPRSIMQGDYMTLDYAEEQVLRSQYQQRSSRDEGTLPVSPATYAYLRVDAQRRARVAALGDTPAAPGGLIALRLRGRAHAPALGPHAFFFQEGAAQVYETAHWGELRVAPDGTALLVTLRDAELRPLGQNRF
ncbi:hypothetical protein D8I35_12675 [Corticibacter populi]|uniref:GDYXXLXY domain-containing protein n=1 Tax=Corticibacter populi TaxID=1550736 RepID=A0A3M6QSH5_9BURK|nr:GDYXXLXY domain-containing protein [Corticibacter populi]RMX05985.1 hypothetical protein D8I35_12675 [Corticibacter populi]RZS30684.1 putative membrane-anchored protein [Corticibacter populi]